jgi:hypothetical protein
MHTELLKERAPPMLGQVTWGVGRGGKDVATSRANGVRIKGGREDKGTRKSSV